MQQISFSVAPAWHPSQLQPSSVVCLQHRGGSSTTVSQPKQLFPRLPSASTTSVTKLERLTRKSGMKRMHAGITFEELFGTSLEFGLCHLSNTCCFFFAPNNLTPADVFKWRTCAGGEAFISFLGLPFDLFLLTITVSVPRAERSLALCPDADAGERI